LALEETGQHEENSNGGEGSRVAVESFAFKASKRRGVISICVSNIVSFHWSESTSSAWEGEKNRREEKRREEKDSTVISSALKRKMTTQGKGGRKKRLASSARAAGSFWE
jgi:hypothetical protein